MDVSQLNKEQIQNLLVHAVVRLHDFSPEECYLCAEIRDLIFDALMEQGYAEGTTESKNPNPSKAR